MQFGQTHKVRPARAHLSGVLKSYFKHRHQLDPVVLRFIQRLQNIGCKARIVFVRELLLKPMQGGRVFRRERQNPLHHCDGAGYVTNAFFDHFGEAIQKHQLLV